MEGSNNTEQERTPLALHFAEDMPAADSGATANYSGGTTGGSGTNEDANIDYD